MIAGDALPVTNVGIGGIPTGARGGPLMGGGVVKEGGQGWIVRMALLVMLLRLIMLLLVHCELKRGVVSNSIVRRYFGLQRKGPEHRSVRDVCWKCKVEHWYDASQPRSACQPPTGWQSRFGLLTFACSSCPKDGGELS